MLKQKRTLYAFESDALEETANLTLCLKEPAPDPDNPVVPLGANGEPDEDKLCYTASVDRRGEGYGMWYQAQDSRRRLTRCFASSLDGFEWKKHGVIGEGLFNTLGNSFNVYNDEDRFLAPLTSLGTDPSIDPAYAALQAEDVPDERRKTAIENSLAKSGRCGVTTFVGIATSDDGLDWKLPPRTPRLPMMLEAPWIYRFRGHYIMNAQTHGAWFDPPVSGVRRVAFFTSDDLVNWKLQPGYMKNTAHEAIKGMTHVGVVPIKRIDERLLIGLGGRFDDEPELPQQHFEVTLLYSTDGLDWKPMVPQVERRNWIRRGRPGEWDFGGVTGMGMTEKGDRAAAYYSGTTIGNGSHAFPPYDPGPCRVGRVCFTRDRFAALQPAVGWNAIFEHAQAGGASGSLMTKPIELSTDRPLTLNLEIPDGAGAEVKVEVLSSGGTVCDSAKVQEGGVGVPVPLEKPAPREPVRLRLTLSGGTAPDRVPRLFAIEY
ncbi:MAG: hypothetical protein R6V03_02070 [Kiritimatiellia bacterium]